jgi:hypothetical protein
MGSGVVGKAAGRDLREPLTGPLKDCGDTRNGLEAANNHVNVERIVFEAAPCNL